MLNALVSTETMTKEEWLKWRNKGIGGSDASVICGVNKYKSAVELWMEKTGQLEPKEAGEAAYWGTVLEPIIREEFTKRTGLEVGIEKSILQHPYHPFMLANLDGMVIDPEKKCGYVFEAKTANPFAADNWELRIRRLPASSTAPYGGHRLFRGIYRCPYRRQPVQILFYRKG